MEKVLMLAHTEPDGSLALSALEALGAAIDLGGELYVGLIGQDPEKAASQIGSCGALKFFGASGAEFCQARYSTDIAAAEALCKAAGESIVVVPATSRWNRVVAGLAHRLGGRADTHVSAIATEADKISINRWYYRQRMIGTVSRQHRPWCIALEASCHEPWQGAAATVDVETVSITVSKPKTEVTGVRMPGSDLETIRPEAKMLFVAGAGWTKKQADGQVHADLAASLILGFLEQSKASLGGSKSVVDLGGEGQAVLPFMTHLNQIGQTGATPRHAKGLSTCCHGEEPHVVGWRFINERRAINMDPNCSWAAGKCDVLYVADAFKVMERVNELLKGRELAASAV